MIRSRILRYILVGLFIGIFHYIVSYQRIINQANKDENLLIRNITIWSNDFHISPIHDIKDQLSTFNVRFIDKSLSGHCHLTDTCAKDLKVLNQLNGIDPSLEVQKQFYEIYKNDSEMNQVDAFLCFHPVGMCELFMPFNRTLIIISSTRYELGRFSKQTWIKLNKNLQIIASNPRNVIAANNLYDAEYIRYFTGIKAVVLPSFCGYTNASYLPNLKKPFLLAPIRHQDFSIVFTSMLKNSKHRLNATINVSHLREVYKGQYQYFELAQHPAIIYIPYQVSVMSLFEQYRMNIPLFFPSIDLLTEWHYKHQIINERTWDGVSGRRRNTSLILGLLDSNVPDPNNEFDPNAIRYWLQFADFYQWPYITYYNSTDDLLIKLMTTNLTNISQNMKIYNENLKKNLLHQWRQILRRTAQKSYY